MKINKKLEAKKEELGLVTYTFVRTLETMMPMVLSHIMSTIRVLINLGKILTVNIINLRVKEDMRATLMILESRQNMV